MDIDYLKLKEKYNTPLYVYDKSVINDKIHKLKDNFKSNLYKTEIIYASKAFSVKEMLRVIMDKGLSLDTVSIGEIYTAINVGFDLNKIYFHGNNKSYDDLVFALNNNVGTIVVDNYMELLLLDEVAKSLNKVQKIMIRLNLGIEAHTHKYIVTSHVDSKFGVLYNSDDYKNMINFINNSNNIKLIGFHSHIGSQIFELDAYKAEIEKLIRISKEFSYPLELNLGGGFGAFYTNEDKPIPLDEVAKFLVKTTDEVLNKENAKIAKLLIEPGRSIVAEAGTTLYTIGVIKKTPNKEYYFIDGGMTDNIRPALYQAKYDAFIVGKENDERSHTVTIAGKCCESGDLIIEDYKLPPATSGDLLVTKTTGAYGYAMSSNYNKALTPAVVFVDEDNDYLVVKRQSLKELIEREI